jgi:hypothetical protein
MKKSVLLISALLLTFAFAFAQEKTPDKSEYVIQSRAASIPGNLAGPATYNRLEDDFVHLTCDDGAGEALAAAYANAVFYDVYPIHSVAGEVLTATATADPAFDSYLFLYCGPFNPANPFANALAADDDDGPVFDAAFTPGDNITLLPNTTYYLVVTSFANGESGAYTLELGGGVVSGPAAPLVPVSNWALYLGIFLMAVFTVIRFRKIF